MNKKIKDTPVHCYIQYSCAQTVWCKIRRLHDKGKLQKVNGTTKALVQQCYIWYNKQNS